MGAGARARCLGGVGGLHGGVGVCAGGGGDAAEFFGGVSRVDGVDPLPARRRVVADHERIVPTERRALGLERIAHGPPCLVEREVGGGFVGEGLTHGDIKGGVTVRAVRTFGERGRQEVGAIGGQRGDGLRMHRLVEVAGEFDGVAQEFLGGDLRTELGFEEAFVGSVF